MLYIDNILAVCPEEIVRVQLVFKFIHRHIDHFRSAVVETKIYRLVFCFDVVDVRNAHGLISVTVRKQETLPITELVLL